MNFSTYFVANILNRVLPFLLLPIITRYLGPEEYGLWSVFQVIIALISPVIGMSMQNSITRNFYRESREEISRIVSNILLILIINFTWTTVLLSVFASQIHMIQGIPSVLLLCIPLISITDSFLQLNTTLLRNQNKAIEYGTFQIGSTALNLILTLVLIALLHLNWHGSIIATVVESAIIGVLSIIFIYQSRYLILDVNKERLFDILRVSLPLIPHTLAAVIMNLSDRVFINLMVDTASVGIYSVGYQFGMIILLVTDAFNLVWTPWMYRQLAHITTSQKRQIVKYTYMYNIGMIVLAVGIALISPYIITILIPKQYHEAQIYVFWVSLGYAFRGMYLMVFSYLVHEGKTGFLAIISSLTALLNIVGNYILIRLNGPIGAAQATLLSFIVLYLGMWWYSNRIYPMPWLLGLRFMRTQA